MSRNLTGTGITDKASIWSILHTLNPFHKTFNGTDPEYVPGFMLDAFAKNKNDQNGYKAAHFLAKLVGGLALGAGAAYGIRALLHDVDEQSNSKINKSTKTGGQSLQGMYKKPTSAAVQDANVKTLQQQQAKKKPLQKTSALTKKAWDPYALIKGIDPYSFGVGVVVPATALLATLGTFVLSDKKYDKQQNDRLERQIEEAKNKQDKINNRRILKARGVQLASNQNKLQKTANTGFLSQQGDILLATGATLLAGLGLVAGFNYQRANDQNYLKYKATKKGLQEFVKHKQNQNTPYIEPVPEAVAKKYDSAINKGSKKQQNAGQDIDSISSFNQVGI